MRLPDTTRGWVDRLDRRKESDHFVVRFSMRNPPPGEAGMGRGAYGIGSQCLVTQYLAALERVYNVLIAPPFLWAKPPKEKSEAYVLYLPSVGVTEAFTAVDRDWIPYICLPSRSEEPILQNSLHRAEIEAVHEATHVFCWTARPPKTLAERKWLWFGEATAVFMEGEVFPGNLESIRFALDWSDFPEWPMDHEHAWYQAGFFIRYLARRFGSVLISKMWNDSAPSDGPLEALNKLLPQEERSSSPDICRVFGDYAHDSFFTWDEQSYGFHQEIFLRFGHRTIAQSFILGAGDHANTDWTVLDHLACRYFRIELTPKVKRLETVIRTKSGSNDVFRCFLTAHRRDQRRGDWKELAESEPAARRRDAVKNRTERVAFLESQSIEDCDWFLLTVANCGTKSRDADPTGVAHDDGREFEIDIRTR